MKRFLALVILVAACGAPVKKKTVGEEAGSAQANDACCCKSTPMTSEDGKPVYEKTSTMECSGKQGTCVPDVQCNAAK